MDSPNRTNNRDGDSPIRRRPHVRATAFKWGPALLPALAIALTSGCTNPKDDAYARVPNGPHVVIEPKGVAEAKDAPEPKINAQTYYATARHVFESAGRLDKAIDLYKKAIEADPKFIDAYDRLAIDLTALGRFDDAEQTLLRAVEIQPKSAALRNNLGYHYLLRRRWADAQREFSRAIALHPQFGRARINLGIALSAQKQFDEALNEYRKALPEPDALYNVGLAYRAHKRYDDAKRCFQRALALNPRFNAAHRQLDWLHRQNQLTPSATTAPPNDATDTVLAVKPVNPNDPTPSDELDWTSLRDSLGIGDPAPTSAASFTAADDESPQQDGEPEETLADVHDVTGQIDAATDDADSLSKKQVATAAPDVSPSQASQTPQRQQPPVQQTSSPAFVQEPAALPLTGGTSVKGLPEADSAMGQDSSESKTAISTESTASQEPSLQESPSQEFKDPRADSGLPNSEPVTPADIRNVEENPPPIRVEIPDTEPQVDVATLLHCFVGPDKPVGRACLGADLDGDGDVDLHDFSLIQIGPTGLKSPVK